MNVNFLRIPWFRLEFDDNIHLIKIYLLLSTGYLPVCKSQMVPT